MSIILSTLILDRLAPEVLIAFSRLTYPVRTRIANWPKFVHAAEKTLESRGIDGRRVLAGLK